MASVSYTHLDVYKRQAMISEEEYEEIRRIRYLNECAAVDLLLKKADRPALEAMAEAAEHTGDVGGNMKFQISLAAAADNPVLTDIIDRLVTSLARSCLLYTSRCV